MTASPRGRRVAVGLLLAGWLCAGAASPGSAGTSDPLASWTPPAGWSLQSEQPANAALLLGCATGTLRVYDGPGGGRVTVERVVCTDAAQASIRQSRIWALSPRSSGAIASALGDELEQDAPSPDGISRRWTQGRYGLQVVARCAAGSTGGCDSAGVAWVRAISAHGPASTSIGAVPSALARPFDRWRPDGNGYWRLLISKPLTAYCPGWAYSMWIGAAQEQLIVSGGTCGSRQGARRAASELWMQAAPVITVHTSSALGGADRVGAVVADGVRTETREWVQGDRLTAIQLSCPGISANACDRRSSTLTRSLSALLQPADPVALQTEPEVLGDFARLVVTVPLIVFGLLALPWRVFDFWRGRGWSTGAVARFTAVDRLVRRTRASWALRRSAVFAVAFVLSALAASGAVSLAGTWSTPIVVIAPFVLGGLCAGIAGVLWKPPMLVRTPRRTGRSDGRRLLGLTCRSAAYLILVVALASYFVAAILANRTLLLSEMTTQAEIHQELTSGVPVAVALGVLTSVLDRALSTNAFVLLFAVSLVIIGVALLLDRFGRRLQRQDLATTLQRDRRPYFLYLRGFDEDALRIREVAGRVGLLEILAPVSRARFEEVLVERLAHFGPVIAIASQKARVADLGAAKASFPNDQWQQRVEEYAGGARAIVMSATPGRIGEGLGWEIRQVSEHREALTLLLVLAPWPRRELRRRWQGFLQHAAAFPPFDGIRDLDLPDGVQVVTWTAAAGWRGYGARRRWDWTHAASLVTAVQDLDAVPASDAPPPERAGV